MAIEVETRAVLMYISIKQKMTVLVNFDHLKPNIDTVRNLLIGLKNMLKVCYLFKR